MRKRKELQKFGLVFGAGISKQFGFPSWDGLLTTIPEACEVPSENGTNSNKSSLAQCLFESFKLKYCEKEKLQQPLNSDQITTIKAEWLKKIIDVLYKDVPENFAELKKRDTYLIDFLEIIKNTKLTVNYNFDDTIQRFLADTRDDHSKGKTLGYKTDWKSDPQLYSQNAVIYHPNGYLPKHTGEKPSDDIVFLDDSFGDQLIDSLTGKYATLANHFAQNTCLFMGLSLEDQTLRNILRRNSQIHPGHVHYYIKHIEKDDAISVSEQNSFRQAIFETYNLITLFLTKEEYSDLAKLLTMDADDLARLYDDYGIEHKYVFYLTGCVAAGKSTCVSFFRSLTIHDEWLETMPSEMNSDPSFVDDKAIEKIDKFVTQQWRKKNISLEENNRDIIIVDRCPLDAFAFTKREEWVQKGEFLSKNFFPNTSSRPLQKGCVILILNAPDILFTRAKAGLRNTNLEKLQNQQELLCICYDRKFNGIIWLDAFNMSKTEVAKSVSRIIHMSEYIACDLNSILEEIRHGEFPSETSE